MLPLDSEIRIVPSPLTLSTIATCPKPLLRLGSHCAMAPTVGVLDIAIPFSRAWSSQLPASATSVSSSYVLCIRLKEIV